MSRDNFNKTIISFLCFLTLPSYQNIENKSAMNDLEKEIVISFWFGKRRLDAFSGIWNLVRLQNEHKQKEPKLPLFPNFLSVRVRNKISKSITVKSTLLFEIQKRFSIQVLFWVAWTCSVYTNASYAKI